MNAKMKEREKQTQRKERMVVGAKKIVKIPYRTFILKQICRKMFNISHSIRNLIKNNIQKAVFFKKK